MPIKVINGGGSGGPGSATTFTTDDAAVTVGFAIILAGRGGVITRQPVPDTIEIITNATSKYINQVAHGLVVGDVVIFDGTDYIPAIATDEPNSEVVGIVREVDDADNFVITTQGWISGLAGLTAGDIYYLSDTVAGTLTDTPTTTTGEVSKHLLVADSTTSGYFNITRSRVNGATAITSITGIGGVVTNTVGANTDIIANATSKEINQVAHGLALGDIVRLSGTSYIKAIATNAANAEVIGIVRSVTDADNFIITTHGHMSGFPAATFIAGTVYFLSASVAGALTASIPTGATEINKPVIFADTTTSAYFINMRGNIVGPANVKERILEWWAGQLTIREATFASTEILEGSTVKTLGDYYDYSTIEYRNGVFRVPSDIDPNATVTFEICWQPRTAPAVAESVVWQIEHCAIADGEDFDGSYIAEIAAADAASTVQDIMQRTTWTETVANLGWVANDTVYFRISRKSDSASDDLDTRGTTADDAAASLYVIRIPRL